MNFPLKCPYLITTCLKLLCIITCAYSKCYKPQESPLQFLCPIDYAEIGGFEMSVNSRKEVKITCANMHSFESDNLPNVTLNVINLLQFRRCPFPKNGFRAVMQKFSAERLIVLTYEFGQQHLNKSAFQEMQRLEYLHLGKNKLKNLDEDVFENTPKLMALELQHNDLTDLKMNLFKDLKLLKFLDLANNQIENLPSGLFQTLKKLEVLELYRNKIRTLNDTSFNGLHSLTTLDLSANEIDSISRDSFQNLTNLTKVSLTGNRLTRLPENFFNNNRNLQSVALNNNRNFHLTDFMFSNFTHLREVDLSNCDLKAIPEHIFETSSGLKSVNLVDNDLKEVPQGLFKGLTYLEKIDLSGNRLENIDDIFSNLHNVKALSLEDNVIKTIDKETFSDLINLEELNLATNKIRQIHPQAFSTNDRLKIINLSRNLYSGGDGLLRNMISLVDVDLSYNLITQVEDISLENKPELETLDLRRNLIKEISLSSLQTISSVEIYLQHNNISIISFEEIDSLQSSHTASIFLQNNPMRCDCKNYDLFKYFNGLLSPKLTSMFKISKDITCGAPTFQSKQILRYIRLSAVTCPLEDLTEDDTGCPEECHCKWRPFDSAIVADCANKKLTELPKLIERELRWANFTEIEFDLRHNNLVSANFTGDENVTRLYLAYNRLSGISSVPKRLKVLTLDHNQLTTLSPRVLDHLNPSHLIKLTLGSNPWICTCDIAILSTFIRQNSKIIDYKQVYCNKTARLVDLSRSDLCQDFTTIILLSLVSVLLAIVATLVTLYYKFQQEVKVWLFSHHWCLWWVSENDLDDVRPFDAFISYSHKDEDFVSGILISDLERCSESYKFCIADRNWIVGETIVTNICNSIACSKRTIFVLSDNFLQSVWTKAEFKQAHSEAIEDGRSRVIIVIYGDIDIEKIEDSALKAYLKTNTYVKWGDPYFWSKLKYSLPHRNQHSFSV